MTRCLSQGFSHNGVCFLNLTVFYCTAKHFGLLFYENSLELITHEESLPVFFGSMNVKLQEMKHSDLNCGE